MVRHVLDEFPSGNHYMGFEEGQSLPPVLYPNHILQLWTCYSLFPGTQNNCVRIMSYWSQRAQSYQRGRSGGRVGSRPRGEGGWRKDDDVPSTPSPPLGSLISSLRKDDIDNAAEGLAKSAEIRDCRTVASYNWLDKKGSEATVLVPGRVEPLPLGSFLS